MGVFADTGALGAMGAQVDGAVEARFLSDPNAVIDFGDDRTTDGTVGTNRLDLLHRLGSGLRFSFLDHAKRHGRSKHGASSGHP